MFLYILKRILMTIPTLLVVIVLTFLLMHFAPGSPFNSERVLPPEVLAVLNHEYHLDKPLPWQLGHYILNLLHGDLGQSYKYLGQSVNGLIFPSNGQGGFWLSLVLGGWVLLLSVVLGISFGIIAALKRNSVIDRIVTAFSMASISVPTVVLAPLLVLVFAVLLGWLPAGGWGTGDIEHLLLPVVSLSLGIAAIIAQIMRSSLIEVMNSPFIKTAKAKGLPIRTIILRHALKPAIIPVVSYLGPAAAAALTGTVIIETVFTLPGLGVLTVQAAINRDYSLMLGLTVLYSALLIAFNLLVDIIYAFLDPKIKY